MGRKRKAELKTEKERPSAKYFRLHAQHEKAVKHWVQLHGADETTVYKVGAFLFMTLPLEQRVRITRQYLEWVRQDYPTETFHWPDEMAAEPVLDHTTRRLAVEFPPGRIAEIGAPPPSK